MEEHSIHLDKLESIVKNITNGFDNPEDSKIFKCLCNFLDTLNAIVCIIRDDFKCIFINKFTQTYMTKRSEYSVDDFINKPCLGMSGYCPIKEKCNEDGVWKSNSDSKIKCYTNIESPMRDSDTTFDVMIIPLSVNGTKGIIEIWIEVE